MGTRKHFAKKSIGVGGSPTASAGVHLAQDDLMPRGHPLGGDPVRISFSMDHLDPVKMAELIVKILES